MWNRLLPDALRGRPLLLLALSFAGGCFAAYQLRLPLRAALAAALFLAVAAALLCLLYHGRRWQPLLLAFAGLGLFLCAGELAATRAWPLANGDYAVVCGTVKGSPTLHADGRFQLRLAVDELDGAPLACGDIIVYGEGEAPRSGSYLRVEGQSFTPAEYGNPYYFSYREYLQRQGVAAQFSAYYGGALLVLREGPAFSLATFGAWLRDCFDTAAQPLSERQRGLLYGVFLGEKSGLDITARQAMADAGLMHLFAVSGLHVGYIVMLALLLAGKGYARRKARFWLTVCLLLLYLCLTGLAASIVRAAVMALTLLLAGLLREEPDSVSTLALAALACLLFRPLWLFDAGFQLSFAAVWGMTALGPALTRLWGGRGSVGASLFAAGCAACLATWPLVCHYFYYVSWLGWLLAPLALPLAGLAVALCFVAVPLAVLLPAAAGWLLQAAGFVMELLAALAHAVASLPFAVSRTGALPAAAVCVFFVLLLLLPALARRWGRRGLLPLLTLLLMLTLWLPQAVSRPRALPDGGPALAEVVFLDVGQGDAAFIITADGRTMLIDGGGKASAPGSIGDYVLLPYLKSRGVSHIDVVVSSHPDFDHIDGLFSALAALRVDTLLYAGVFAADETQQALLAAARARGCKLLPVSAGDRLRLGEYLRLDVCGPAGAGSGDANDDSLVLRLGCGAVDLLFTGDASGAALAALAAEYDLAAEVVKLPHHGSNSGYDTDFYAAAAAEAVILSVGAANSYGHPAPDVVEYWQERAAVYRTDRMGAVSVRTDGRSFVVTTETPLAGAS